MINAYECSKAGEKDSKSFWVGSIPTVRANFITMINTYECSKAGEKDSKSFWVGSIPTVRANFIKLINMKDVIEYTVKVNGLFQLA